MTELPDILVRWTIRLAVASYFVRLIADFGRFKCHIMGPVRWAWTIGAAMNLLHVFLTMYFVHDMSHQKALEHTAQQTGEVFGFYWGGGVYVNYLFSILWMVDVYLWWTRGLMWPRQKVYYLVSLHLIFAFIVINATAVFGPGFWLVITPAGYLLALAIRLRQRRRNRLFEE